MKQPQLKTDIDRGVFQGQRAPASDWRNSHPVGQAGRLGIGPGAGDQRRIEIESDDPRAQLAGQDQRRPTDAAADVDHQLVRGDRGRRRPRLTLSGPPGDRKPSPQTSSSISTMASPYSSSRAGASVTGSYQGALIMTLRDRLGDPPGRRGAAGDAAHRPGFPTPSGGSPRRPEGRLAKAFGRRCGRLPMPHIAAPPAPSRKPWQAVSKGHYRHSLVSLLRQ